MPSILLVRHGQASFGSADYDVLSDLGADQVRALHAALTRDGAPAPARLVAGGLRRQRDSALPWTEAGAELATDARWDEYDTADVMGAHAEVDASLEDPRGRGGEAVSSARFQDVLDPALERWVAAGEDTPARESWPAFRGRAVAALEELAGALGRGESAMVFTSGGVIAACAAAVLGAPDPVFVALNRTAINAGVTKVLVGRRGLSLVSYNEHAHLRPEQVTYR